LDIDSRAFNVLFDAGDINLQICYKGVPIQIITFCTSDDSPTAGKDIEDLYTMDALNLGYQILFLFVMDKRGLPEHIIEKAQEIEKSGVMFSEDEWKAQQRASEIFFGAKNVCAINKAKSLKELLINEKSNYRYYAA
jgi:hypothetical protein